jgi:hypothetical protein
MGKGSDDDSSTGFWLGVGALFAYAGWLKAMDKMGCTSSTCQWTLSITIAVVLLCGGFACWIAVLRKREKEERLAIGLLTSMAERQAEGEAALAAGLMLEAEKVRERQRKAEAEAEAAKIAVSNSNSNVNSGNNSSVVVNASSGAGEAALAAALTQQTQMQLMIHQQQQSQQQNNVSMATPVVASTPASINPVGAQEPQLDLESFLGTVRLAHFADSFRSLGCDCVEDVMDMDDDDMIEIGIKKVEIKRMKRLYTGEESVRLFVLFFPL